MTFLKDMIAKIMGWGAYVPRQFLAWLKRRRALQKNIPAPLRLPAPDSKAATKQYEQHASPEYMELKMIFRDIGRMNAILETLGRDFLTAMPEGAYKSRLSQIGFMYRKMHEELANQNMASLIEKAHAHEQKSPDAWDPWDHANLREMEIMYRHHCQVDPVLIEKRARLMYEGRRVHRDVKNANDWATARPFLENMVDLQRKIAESKCLRNNHHDTELPYQALLKEYIPGTNIDEVEGIFSELEKALKTMLPKILDAQNNRPAPIPLNGVFEADQQMWLNKSLLSVMGFDFNRGGLYATGHNPVEGGTPDDTRLVILTADTSTFLSSMKSALHEGGHGIYIQGLPRDVWRYQPVGQDLGAAVQESQALLIEMILGRTREFFEYLSPRAEGLFQKFADPAMTADNLFALRNWVQPTWDRRNADEITYFFHIRLRMTLERELMAGTLAVKDLPEAWNAGIYDMMGVEPKTYAQGCLQDVHWFVGKFGYFPSYTMGHIYAAQIHDAMKRDLQNIPDLMRAGNFRPVRDWLHDRIYQKGRLKRPAALMEEITGSKLSIKPLLNHFEERYLVEN